MGVGSKEIRGDFYRIPFLVFDGKVTHVFPLKGTEITYRANSDFHWTSFDYTFAEKLLASRFIVVLQRIADLYHATNGSFVAELLFQNEEVYVLEFSPRQTSTRVSKVVRHATGIDLELVAVDLFYKTCNAKKIRDKDVKMIIRRGTVRNEVVGYKLIEVEREVSVYNDAIEVRYYEKADK